MSQVQVRARMRVYYIPRYKCFTPRRPGTCPSQDYVLISVYDDRNNQRANEGTLRLFHLPWCFLHQK